MGKKQERQKLRIPSREGEGEIEGFKGFLSFF